ncbi:MBL fold metallo-hydrolase [Paenibacillus allorhizosphaerae]|uniref:Hydroxyacylglutathione hydrolase n=1 Tax=Paenibacillus allorhizosphaerae TaxID=2849866 RepID=A0ABM8VL06_9BACL|nr:MBL fold metallo-hydrolase [Paenibacillus allorhizosphaerae]CAG7647918.1 Hydroxyacylglutathione hydrolase [Paenibacillus allorhizosphaerae]
MTGHASAASAVKKHGDIVQVKVPLPFPLRWVNSYLVPGRSGWTLIDPGLRTEAAEALWDTALAELGIAYGQIERIVLTHHHPDHYGLTGWFQQRSGAPVLLSRTGLEQARRLWGDGQPMTEQLLALFQGHGLPPELREPMREHMDGFVPSVSPQPDVTALEAGDTVCLGDDAYVSILTPGHAAGHLCFYRAETGVLFCGDHVLPQISPNVSYLPGGIDENPLDSYMRSLRDIAGLEVRLAFPGHREPFPHLAQRAHELIRHHEERLEGMRQLLAQPRTAYDVCRLTFGDRLSLHQLRFALSETIAHLIWLREAGRAEEYGRDGVVCYKQ